MKNGFRVLDSDLHTMEPDGLWERYLDEPFKRFAPKFVRSTHNAPNQPVIQIGDLAIAEMSKRPHTAVVGKDLQRRAFQREGTRGVLLGTGEVTLEPMATHGVHLHISKYE